MEREIDHSFKQFVLVPLLPLYITRLNLSNNVLHTIDLNIPTLQQLNISFNKIQTCFLSNCSSLKDLAIGYNSELNHAELPLSITSLNMVNCPLQLDLQQFQLESLSCDLVVDHSMYPRLQVFNAIIVKPFITIEEDMVKVQQEDFNFKLTLEELIAGYEDGHYDCSTLFTYLSV